MSSWQKPQETYCLRRNLSKRNLFGVRVWGSYPSPVWGYSILYWESMWWGYPCAVLPGGYPNPVLAGDTQALSFKEVTMYWGTPTLDWSSPPWDWDIRCLGQFVFRLNRFFRRANCTASICNDSVLHYGP